MGGELSHVRFLESIMTRLAELASALLEPVEREVVCGDLAESGEFGWRALRQVLSLGIRRLALSFKNVGPWLVLVTLAITTSVLLSLLARRTADGSAIYLWSWINNSDWAIIQSAGFWRLVLEYAPSILLSYLALACCSWTCGLLIGWSERRTHSLSGLVLLAVVVAVGALNVPRSLGHILVLQRARDFDNNTAVFLALFYQRVCPVVLEIFLVILPAWSGMRQSSEIIQLGRSARRLMMVISTSVLGVLISQTLLWWQVRVWDTRPLHFPRLPSLAPLALAAPAAYLFLIARHRLTLHRARQS